MRARGSEVGARRVVRQRRVVNREVDRIEAETVNAAIQPEPRDIEQSVLHGGRCEG